MTAAFTGLKKLVIPDSESLRATPEMMHLLNSINDQLAILQAYQEPDPEIPDQIVIQIQSDEDGSIHTTTDAIPLDDTIPQSDEGEECQTLSFTPLQADSKIRIEWKGFTAGNNSDGSIVALFQSASADALDASAPVAGHNVTLGKTLDSWGTTARTISVRFGRAGNSTAAYVGSTLHLLPLFNERMLSVLTITEYKNSA